MLVVLTGVLDVRVGIAGGDLIFFGLDTSGPPRWVVLPVVFVAVAAVMACLGDGVARSFARLGNLDAYQLDLVGGLLGVIAFAVLSFAYAEPVVWGTITAVGLLVAIRPRRSGEIAAVAVPLVLLVVALGIESAQRGHDVDAVLQGPHANRSATPVASSPRSTGSRRGCSSGPSATRCTRRCTSASRPTHPGEVLIIGAGSGNDVAVALARGATAVDAVEIDGHLLDVGRIAPRPALRRPAGRHSRRRRSGVPGGDRSAVGHDPARPAGLAHAAPGPVVGTPGELPVHRRSRRVVP